MNYKTDIVFVPTDFSGEMPSTSRIVSIQTKTDKKMDEFRTLGRQKAMDDDFIDEYALRRHWRIAGGQTSIIDEPWNTRTEVQKQVSDISGVNTAEISQKENEEMMIIKLESHQKTQEIKTKLEDMYGNNIILRLGRFYLYLFFRYNWSVSYDFDLVNNAIKQS